MIVDINDLSNVRSIARQLRKIERFHKHSICRVSITASFAKPIPTLVIGSAISRAYKAREQLGLERCVIDTSVTEAVSYLKNLGFFEMLGVKGVGRKLKNARSTSQYMTIHKLPLALHNAIESNLHANAIAERAAIVLSRNKQSTAKCSTDDCLLYRYIYRELIRNVLDHSRAKQAYIYGQRYKNDTAQIAIVDNGIGMYQSLARKYSWIKNDLDALALSIEPGVSSNDIIETANSGFGLYVLTRLAGMYGFAVLGSGLSQIYINEDNGQYQKEKTSFIGTYVGLEITKIVNVDKVLDDIVADGEQEARELGRSSGPSASKRI